MKKLRLIISVEVEGDVALAPLRHRVKARLRALGVEAITFRREDAPGIERTMQANFRTTEVKQFGRRKESK